MKKITLILAIFATLILASCSKEETTQTSSSTYTNSNGKLKFGYRIDTDGNCPTVHFTTTGAKLPIIVQTTWTGKTTPNVSTHSTATFSKPDWCKETYVVIATDSDDVKDTLNFTVK